MSIDEQWDLSDLVGKVAAGRYVIVAELRSDDRRTIYEAEDVEQGTRVALGVLRAATASDGGAKLRSLRHPNLAEVLDTGKLDSGEPFFTTEIVRGMSLRALMNGGHLEQRRALSIGRQVLQALAAVHEVGAVHGDVKPENVTITTDAHGVECAKLLDLGATMLSSADRVGDPRYRAPECASGSIDPRADLYSVGAMLFELLTDRPPFFVDDASALSRMHAYAPVQTLRQRAPQWGYAPELEELVATALAKKPDERFRSADEMTVALDAAMKSSAEAVQPAPTARAAQPAVDDSLALLAQGLVPVAERHSELVIPLNTSRQVRELPWPTRALKLARRLLGRIFGLGATPLAWFRRLGRTQRLIAVAAGGALVLAVVIAIAVSARGGDRATAATTDVNVRASSLASRARSLLDARKPDQAAALIERELAAHPDDSAAYLVLGHARIALGRPGDGLAAYDRAIRLAPALANEPELLANVKQVSTSRDPATAIRAIELLSSSTSPDAQDAVVAHASNPVADVRHRAFALAERAGLADRIDRVSSWTLDMQHATTCAERRTIIAKLASTMDPRALPALGRARTHRCGKREAIAAIQKINTAAKPR